jgi:hypothetical protein
MFKQIVRYVFIPLIAFAFFLNGCGEVGGGSINGPDDTPSSSSSSNNIPLSSGGQAPSSSSFNYTGHADNTKHPGASEVKGEMDESTLGLIDDNAKILPDPCRGQASPTYAGCPDVFAEVPAYVRKSSDGKIRMPVRGRDSTFFKMPSGDWAFHFEAGPNPTCVRLNPCQGHTRLTGTVPYGDVAVKFSDMPCEINRNQIREDYDNGV